MGIFHIFIIKYKKKARILNKKEITPDMMKGRWKSRVDELATGIKNMDSDKAIEFNEDKLKSSCKPLTQEDNKLTPSPNVVREMTEEDLVLKTDRKLTQDKQSQIFPSNYLSTLSNKNISFQQVRQAKIRKLIKNIKFVLTPFSSYYNSMDIGDAFYFTQRFYAPIMVGFTAFAVLFIIIIAILISIIVAINAMKINIHKTSYSFINFAAANALIFNEGFTDKDLQPIEDVIGEINGYFDQFVTAVLIGLLIALGISSMFFAASVILSMRTFRRHVIKLRIGKWSLPVPRETFTIVDSVRYSGIVISNFMIGFIIVLITLGLVFMLLSLKIFWQFIAENYMFFAVILTPFIIENCIMAVMQTASPPGFVTWRKYYS